MLKRVWRFKIGQGCAGLACAKLILLFAAGEAFSQTPPAPPAAQLAPSEAPNTPPPSPAEPPRGNPGLVEEFGKLLKKSADDLSSTFKGSQQTLQDLQTRTKDATDNLTKMQTVVTGRAVCPVAANGAPDCDSASKKLCEGKGYKEGKSLDIETSEKCAAKVYISGRTGAPGECQTNNYVTRAVCQ